jgi:hypothetical protein
LVDPLPWRPVGLFAILNQGELIRLLGNSKT